MIAIKKGGSNEQSLEIRGTGERKNCSASSAARRFFWLKNKNPHLLETMLHVCYTYLHIYIYIILYILYIYIYYLYTLSFIQTLFWVNVGKYSTHGHVGTDVDRCFFCNL